MHARLKEFNDHLYLEKGLRKSTADGYCNKIKSFIKRIDLDPLKMTKVDLLDFIRSLKKDQIALSTQRLYITIIKVYFRFLSDKYKVENIAASIRAPRAESKIPDILSREEVEAMILAYGLKDPVAIRNTAILCVLADTGVRVGELVKLRVGHLKKEKNQFILTVVDEVKNYKARQIPFCYFESGGLIAENFMTYYLFLIRSGVKESDFLFQSDSYRWKIIDQKAVRGSENPSGRHQLSRIYIDQIVKKAAKKAGLNKTPSPHDFRHFYATYLAVDGLDVHKIRQRLGHSSLERTQIYIHYADIVNSDSAKLNPLSGKKAQFSGVVNAIKGER